MARLGLGQPAPVSRCSKKEERLEPDEGCPGPHAEIAGSRFGPEIERLFMELREAVSLLLSFRGHGGKAAL